MAAGSDFQHYAAVHDQIEASVGLTFPKDDLVALEMDFLRERSQPFQILRLKAFQYALAFRVLNEFLDADHSPPPFVFTTGSAARRAATSSVRSIPARHPPKHRRAPCRQISPN